MSRTIHFQSRRHEGGADSSSCYEVGGAILVSDQTLPELQPFEIVPSPRALEVPPPLAGGETGGAILLDEQGWVGGRRTRVVCTRLRSSYRVVVERGGSFEVSEDGRRIVDEGGGREPLEPLERQSLLGPCLSLAMAAQGVYCLHAAAIRRGSVAWALLGESASGKSTLARSLGEDGSIERLADDLLPVTLQDGQLWALPRFPQLKLPPEEQWTGERALRLASGFLLRPELPTAKVEIETLSPRQALLALLRHTVAARLFDGELRRAHLDFAAQAADSVALFGFRVPWTLERLPEVCREITRLGHR